MQLRRPKTLNVSTWPPSGQIGLLYAIGVPWMLSFAYLADAFDAIGALVLVLSASVSAPLIGLVIISARISREAKVINSSARATMG